MHPWPSWSALAPVRPCSQPSRIRRYRSRATSEDSFPAACRATPSNACKVTAAARHLSAHSHSPRTTEGRNQSQSPFAYLTSLSLLLLHLSPGILQRDRSVEYRLARLRIRIDAEISQPF